MSRIMGLDYGDKRIGVSLSDELRWTAQGLEVIHHTSLERVISRLREIVQLYNVTDIVVGLPKNMNATIGPRGELSIDFAETLREELKLPVVLWDERLTSVFAERTLIEADVSRKKRKLVIDKLAASIILQGYLDSIIKK